MKKMRVRRKIRLSIGQRKKMKQFTHCQSELMKKSNREMKRKLECNKLNEEEVERKI